MKGKYALSTLETLRLKWSHPSTFNDPFDIQVDLRFPFTVEELTDRMVAIVEDLLFSPTEPSSDAENEILALVREMRLSEKKPPRGNFGPWFRANFQEVLNKASEQLFREDNERWRSWWRDKKIFCVVEEPDNILIWAHYAESHKGAVLKLRCLPERGTALCIAKPVVYRDELPSLGTLEVWARCVIGVGETPRGTDIFADYWLTKSRHWAYEKEWRTITRAEDTHGPSFALLEAFPEEIAAVYLGCRMPEEMRAAIADQLQRPDLKHVDLYQAEQSATRFALEFRLLRQGDSVPPSTAA
jgi:hypothetical protein